MTRRATYSSPLARLSSLRVTDGAGSLRDRGYGYDAVGNVTTIWDNWLGQTLSFSYDHRDRLTHAWTSGTTTGADDQWMSYDAIGNLTSKAGVGSSYGANGNGTGAGPHQARTVGGSSYTYDQTGNLTSGGGRTYTWDGANRPLTVTSSGVTERYRYDADGARIARTVGGQTTMYTQGLWEDTIGVSAKRLYRVNGQIVASRDGGTNAVTSLHGDHLGSVSLTTTSSGALLSQQEFDPWGKVRSGVPQTTLHDTGQRLDGTGLLYYHARYDDPGLGRFISADRVVPGAGALTSSPSDATAAPLFAQGPKDKDGKPTAPSNPQDLNRYAYGLNNPVRNTDPTGHCPMCIGALIGGGIDLAVQLATNGGDVHKVNWVQVGVSAAVGATGVGVGAVVGRATSSIALSIAGNGLASAGASALGAEAQNRLQEIATPGQFAPVDPQRAAVVGFVVGAPAGAIPTGVSKGLAVLEQVAADRALRRLTLTQTGRLSAVKDYGQNGPTVGQILTGVANAASITFSNSGAAVDPSIPR